MPDEHGKPLTLDTPAIRHAFDHMVQLFWEGRITLNDARIYERGILALVEKENRMIEQ